MAYKRISPVPVVEGGTGAQTFMAHGVLVGEATSAIAALTAGNNGQVIIGATGADPAFATLSSSGSTLTYTTGANTLNIDINAPVTVPNGGTGRITLTNHSLLVGAGTSAITQLGVASNGQLPIGSAGADPVLATLTAGTGISITNGAGSITITSTGGGLTWTVITANQTAAVNNGYFCNKAGTLALALPSVSAVGDTVRVTNENTALGVQFTQAAGQQILIGNTNTTLGATGTLTSSAVGDTLEIVCYTANTIWRTTSMIGNWTPA